MKGRFVKNVQGSRGGNTSGSGESQSSESQSNNSNISSNEN